MRILHVVPTFFPATYWGGPIYSLYGLCNVVARLPEIELRVLTTDAAGPRRVQRVTVDSWPERYPDGYDVYFCKRLLGIAISPSLIKHLWGMVRWADVVHLTAVYSFPTLPTLLTARLLGKPVIWSPRGALQRWAGTRRSWLKWFWEQFCWSLISPGRTVLHVTSGKEAVDSGERFRSIRCVVIPNGVGIPAEAGDRVWMPNGQLRLLYLGRLDPIKGIENLLEALALLPMDKYSLRICGEGEPDYVESLRKTTVNLGVDTRVEFSGKVDGIARTMAFFSSDLCVVPSFTENFGMVVAESLAHGTPVIASTGTPWEDLQTYNCGLWIDNQANVLAHAITEIRKGDLAAMGARGREWIRRDFSLGKIASRMRTLYEDLASDGVDRSS